MRQFVWALVMMAGCSPCGEPLPLQTEVISDNGTFVAFDAATGVLSLRHDSGWAVSTGGDGRCSAFSAALRPPGTDPRRFHGPEAPPEDLVWMHLRSAEVTGDGQWTLALRSDDGTEAASATLSLSQGAQGFVDAEFALEAPDDLIALVAACFRLPEDQPVHAVGAGETFEGVDLMGRTTQIYFQAPAQTTSGLNEKHVPVPFIATTEGLGLWVETERVAAIDMGETDRGEMVFRAQGKTLPMRLRLDSIVGNAAAHARRVGLPPMPPRWVLTPQAWRNELAVTVEDGEVTYTGQDRFLEDARRLRELGIPGSVLWVDAPWSTGYNTFEFNRVQFPDPEAMLAEAERLGFRTIVWATEQINSSNDEDQQVGMPEFGSRDLFEEWREKEWLVKTSVGTPFEFAWGRGFGGFADFTHPEAFKAYGDLARPIMRMGIRGFKLDFCETMRPDLLGIAHNDTPVFFDGTNTEVQHTRYARLFHESMIRVLQEEHPDDWYVITRTGGIHDQRNGTTIWPGDLENDFEPAGVVQDDGNVSIGGLPGAISGGLSVTLSGYPLYGSDIGGYRGGTPNTEVLLRWAQFGALSTVMQLGGGGTGDATHFPWDDRYDTETAIPIYRRYARLHMRLLPTLEAIVKKAVTTGHPPLLPVGVVAQNEAAWADLNTFVFADRLVAAPVVEEGATERSLVLPEGRWIDWWQRRRVLDGGSHTVAAPLDTMPLFQRAGSVLALAHPELMTSVEAEAPEVSDPSAVGEAWELLTSTGPADRLELADGTMASQITDAQGTRISVEQSRARQVVFRVVLDGVAADGVSVSADGEAVTLETAEDPWACDGACQVLVDDELVVVATGRRLEVQF